MRPAPVIADLDTRLPGSPPPYPSFQPALYRHSREGGKGASARLSFEERWWLPDSRPLIRHSRAGGKGARSRLSFEERWGLRIPAALPLFQRGGKGACARLSFEERWPWDEGFLDSRLRGNDGMGWQESIPPPADSPPVRCARPSLSLDGRGGGPARGGRLPPRSRPIPG